MEFEIKPADIILVSGTGKISKLIEEIENSKFSHSAIYVKNNELIEAEGIRKVGYQVLDYYDERATVFRCDILTNKQRNKIVEYVIKTIGYHYDFRLLFLELISYLFDILIPYKGDKDSRICSTLVVDAYRSVGVDLCLGIGYPSPKDVSESELLRVVGTY